MTAELLIVAPVLGRPQNAARLAESVQEATRATYRLVFVCSPGDAQERSACVETGAEVLDAPWRPHRGDYARKVNLAHSRGREPWTFQAADDLRFEPGWDEIAIECGEKACAGVVGTNDLGNPRVTSGQASTHSLIRRSYVERHGGSYMEPGFVLHPGYWHNFCDEELVNLALHRGEFAFARHCHVEHLHPHWRKAEMDDTYKLGLARFHEDAKLYRRRQRVWLRAL